MAFVVCYCKNISVGKIKVSLRNFRKHIVKWEITELRKYNYIDYK